MTFPPLTTQSSCSLCPSLPIFPDIELGDENAYDLEQCCGADSFRLALPDKGAGWRVCTLIGYASLVGAGSVRMLDWEDTGDR